MEPFPVVRAAPAVGALCLAVRAPGAVGMLAPVRARGARETAAVSRVRAEVGYRRGRGGPARLRLDVRKAVARVVVAHELLDRGGAEGLHAPSVAAHPLV